MGYKHKRLLIAVVATLTIASCGRRIGDRYSSSINISKSRDIFITEYNSKDIHINDTINFSIKRILAEKKYKVNSYKYFAPFKILQNKSQLVLVIEPSWGELWKNYGYSETWKFSNMYSVRKDTWVIDFNSPIPPDTVIVEVINDEADSTGRAGIHYGDKIGEFIIIKKIDSE